jgi:hypothetical protein
MCVIIVKNPGIEIDPMKIETACHVNKDGWGLSVLDRGKLETRHDFTPSGNKPEDVINALEQARDCKAYLHLRYTTRGARDLTNCHPFQIATLGTHGQDIWFMHNGTLSGFVDESDRKRSDSHMFADTLLSGLVSKLAKNGETPILNDEYFRQFLNYFAGSSSVFTLYDNNGNEIIVDQSKGGHQWEGWWSSNKYSFDRHHRGYSYNNNTEWDKTAEGVWYKKTIPFPSTASGSSSGNSVVPFTGANANENDGSVLPPIGMGTDESSISIKEQCEIIGTAREKAKALARKNIAHTPPNTRFTFAELSGFTSLEEFFLFTEEEIEDIVDEAPEAATLLILDLIHELYKRGKNEPSQIIPERKAS